MLELATARQGDGRGGCSSQVEVAAVLERAVPVPAALATALGTVVPANTEDATSNPTASEAVALTDTTATADDALSAPAVATSPSAEAASSAADAPSAPSAPAQFLADFALLLNGPSTVDSAAVPDASALLEDVRGCRLCFRAGVSAGTPEDANDEDDDALGGRAS